TLSSFLVLRTAQVGQKYAANNLHQRLDHRAIFVVDGVKRSLANRNFLAVQYRNIDGNTTPKRKIVRGSIEIDTVVGICREPRCN
ncbi:MAG: hypothetical protein EB120_08600, partial [Proteobacteria bacterium]|nr:hypothetical protein [Pseudomonadota bacterium]